MEKNEKQLTPSDAKKIVKKILAERNKKAEYFQANGTLKGFTVENGRGFVVGTTDDPTFVEQTDTVCKDEADELF